MTIESRINSAFDVMAEVMLLHPGVFAPPQRDSTKGLRKALLHRPPFFIQLPIFCLHTLLPSQYLYTLSIRIMSSPNQTHCFFSGLLTVDVGPSSPTALRMVLHTSAQGHKSSDLHCLEESDGYTAAVDFYNRAHQPIRPDAVIFVQGQLSIENGASPLPENWFEPIAPLKIDETAEKDRLMKIQNDREFQLERDLLSSRKAE